MEIKVNDFFAKRERIQEALHNLLQKRIAEGKEKAKQVAENHKLKAFEDSKLKGDYIINCDCYFPEGHNLPQLVGYVRTEDNYLLIEMPHEVGRNIALKAADQYVGFLLDRRV